MPQRKDDDNLNKRMKAKDEKWLKNYGVRYTDCLDKKEEKNGKKVKVSYLKKLSFAWKPYKWSIALFFVLGLLSALIGVLQPIFNEKIIDNLTSGSVNQIIKYAGLLAVVLILVRVINHGANNVVNATYQKIWHDLRMKMFYDVSRTKFSKLDKLETGGIVNKIYGSASTFSAGLVNFIMQITELVGTLAFVVYGFVVSVWLGLILLVFGFASYLIRVLYAEKIRKPIERANEMVNDKQYSQCVELVKGMRDVKSLNGKPYIFSKLKKNSQYGLNISTKNVKTVQVPQTYNVICNAITTFAFFVVAALLIGDGQITIGAAVVMILYKSKYEEFFSILGDLYESKVEMEVQSERISNILSDKEYPKEVFGNKTLTQVKGEIDFNNVSFGYNDKLLFENLNLHINPKTCVGIVGKSGEGKSSILSLLSRFYDVNAGSITIDGVNVNDLTEESLRQVFSVVPQSPYIFDTTVKENLLIGCSNASMDEIVSACEKANIAEFINSLPEGYDTVLGEGGLILSGGQRQRLAIARAIIKKSKILLFDEATSAIDNIGQQVILESIQKLREDHTIIIIAHRLTTIKECDDIIVLDNHKIVSHGTHEELMLECPQYKELYMKEDE